MDTEKQEEFQEVKWTIVISVIGREITPLITK